MFLLDKDLDLSILLLLVSRVTKLKVGLWQEFI